MKNSNHLTKLAISFASPALCAWLLAGCTFSPDTLLGAYTLAGLFYLTAADYLPAHSYAMPAGESRRSKGWIRSSFSRSTGRNHPHRQGKFIA